MAVTAREQQIIDLDEAGYTVSQIAAKLGLRKSYVTQRIKDLCRGLGGNGGFDAMIEQGSRSLLAAIEREMAL